MPLRVLSSPWKEKKLCPPGQIPDYVPDKYALYNITKDHLLILKCNFINSNSFIYKITNCLQCLNNENFLNLFVSC